MVGVALGTAKAYTPGHSILRGLKPGLDARGSKHRAQDGPLGHVGLGPGPGTAAPLELVVRAGARGGQPQECCRWHEALRTGRWIDLPALCR